MPQRPRDYAPGVHHVWVNATGNWDYFLDTDDRNSWIRELVHVTRRHGWTTLAFCQMTTHVHLIVETADESLPLGMAALSREYGKGFNVRHQRVGYLVRKRYGSRRIVDATDLLGVVAYVALNPVAQRLCRHAEDWLWSSYATAIGVRDDFPFVDPSLVLAELGGSIDALRTLVAARARDMAASDTSGSRYRT